MFSMNYMTNIFLSLGVVIYHNFQTRVTTITTLIVRLRKGDSSIKFPNYCRPGIKAY